MRFSARQILQVIFVTSCVATITLLSVVLKGADPNSDARNGGIKVLGQFSSDRGRKHGDVVKPYPGTFRDDQAIDSFQGTAKSGRRRVSSLNGRYDRDVSREIVRENVERGDSSRTGAESTIEAKRHPSDKTGTKMKFRQQNSNTNSRPTELSDIFISVKTSKKFHRSRLDLLLDTWISSAKEQTYIFSDADDPEIEKKIEKNHLINTNCNPDHSRRALCCKMSAEYDYFMDSNKRWFCHVDDDNYVNIPALVNLLQKYNHTKDWYLGKASLDHPISIREPSHPEQKIAFWFATGGAGICISRGLALKMMPYAGGGKLMSVGEKIRLPDDVTVGYIINHILKKDLTEIKTFRSHLEGLSFVQAKDLHKQVTFSYSASTTEWNVVNVPNALSSKVDPTRFRSIHCHLFPYLKQCPATRLR